MPNVEQPPWAKLADGGDPWYEQGPEGITLPDEFECGLTKTGTRVNPSLVP